VELVIVLMERLLVIPLRVNIVHIMQLILQIAVIVVTFVPVQQVIVQMVCVIKAINEFIFVILDHFLIKFNVPKDKFFIGFQFFVTKP